MSVLAELRQRLLRQPPELREQHEYAGYLHTDHAIRTEFFKPHDAPITREEPYLMDFAYIFDPGNPDHQAFMAGVRVSKDEVVSELGHPSGMRTIASDSTEEPAPRRPAHISKRIQEALAETHKWRLTDEEEARLR